MNSLTNLRGSILKKAKDEIKKEELRDDEYDINGYGTELKYLYDKLCNDINNINDINEINKISDIYFIGDPNEFDENSSE
jgi:hypothetical protein